MLRNMIYRLRLGTFSYDIEILLSISTRFLANADSAAWLFDLLFDLLVSCFEFADEGLLDLLLSLDLNFADEGFLNLPLSLNLNFVDGESGYLLNQSSYAQNVNIVKILANDLDADKRKDISVLQHIWRDKNWNTNSR